jgi:hypothetical protein
MSNFFAPACAGKFGSCVTPDQVYPGDYHFIGIKGQYQQRDLTDPAQSPHCANLQWIPRVPGFMASI